MRKEVLFAIIAGSLFGAVIAFGIWRANVALKTKSDEAVTETPESTPLPEAEFGLTIAKPQENSVLTESPLKVAGITQPGVYVVISGDEEDLVTKSNAEGEFEQDVELTGGVNQLVVTAFIQEGPAEEKLTVVFSTEFLKDAGLEKEEEPAPSQESTDAADIIREKVQEKVEAARKNPKAFIGTVTDITENGIQIKNEAGEILQVAVSQQETNFVKIAKTTTSVKFADIAIGDFLVAMGFADGNGVLAAKRILITEPLESTTSRAVLGEVTEIDRKKVTIKTKEGNEFVLEFGVKWVGPELNQISEGDRVIAAGETDEGVVKVRTLFVTEEPASPTLTPTPSPTP